MKWEYGRKRARAMKRRALLGILLAVAFLLVGYVLMKQGGAVPYRLSLAVRSWPDKALARIGIPSKPPPGQAEECVRSEFLMDTYVSIRAAGAGSEEAVAAAFDEMRRIEKLMTRFAPGSDIFRVNEASGGDPVRVSGETFMLIERAFECSRLTEGAFDVTIGPVVDAWGFGTDSPRVPEDAELDAACSLVGWHLVELDPEMKTVRLPISGMSLDLGGIAKGYAAERARETLRERGISHALIDAGGNIVAVGTRPDGKPWQIGVRDPRGESPAETIGPTISLNDAAVATSGDYERFFMEGQERYHHIFDPKTGRPATFARSATVIAKDSSEADMLSTAIFVLGPGKGMELVERMDGVSAMIVDSSGNLSFSSGFSAR